MKLIWHILCHDSWQFHTFFYHILTCNFQQVVVAIRLCISRILCVESYAPPSIMQFHLHIFLHSFTGIYPGASYYPTLLPMDPPHPPTVCNFKSFHYKFSKKLRLGKKKLSIKRFKICTFFSSSLYGYLSYQFYDMVPCTVRVHNIRPPLSTTFRFAE